MEAARDRLRFGSGEELAVAVRQASGSGIKPVGSDMESGVAWSRLEAAWDRLSEARRSELSSQRARQV